MTAKPLATTDEREAREGGVGTRVNRDVLAEALCNLLVDNNKKTQQELSYNRTAPLATTDERETRGGGVGTSVNGDALAEALCNNVLVDNNKKTQQELSYNRTANVNTDVRVFWLGQVSAAATSLAGTQVPREFGDSDGVTKISDRTRSTSLSIRRDGSFYPDTLAKSDLQCRSKPAILSRLMITLVVLACISLIASSEFTSIGTNHRLTSEGLNGSLSSPSSPDAVKATVGEPFRPRLLPMSQAPAIRPVQDAALPILVRQTVQGEGGPETTSIGPRPVDRNGDAAVPSSSSAAGQIHLAQAAPSPSVTLHQLNRAESGKAPSILAEPIQLKTNRDQIIPQHQLDSEDAAPSVSAVTNVAVPPVSPATNSSIPQHQLDSEDAAPSVSAVANSSPPPVQRQLNSEDIIVLLKRGKDLIAAGDLAAARIVLRKAADANDAEAALALAATYDPLVLRELKVYGFMPDAALARAWYAKATELGAPAASRRLEILTKETGQR